LFGLPLNLDHPYRLIFEPFHDPLPQKPDGGMDWTKVSSVTIIGIEDTHD
jgi:proteic killer suppression protein